MSENNFFVKKGPYPLSKVIKEVYSNKKIKEKEDINITGFESLLTASNKDITFLNSSKYQSSSIKTNAIACITSPNLVKFLPKTCIAIEVKNVLFAVTQVAKMFYPKADMDFLDVNLVEAQNLKKTYPDVKFGKNVMIGLNVKIGKNSQIASNTIIESNVAIGESCVIGSSVTIRNSIIHNNVYIQDGCKIGVKGFGFIPSKDKNIRTPHTGKVVLNEYVEIGANSTIDRGSLANTVIGKNTFLDNQVHVAHNVQIGKNCMIAGQVGFAGSSILGDNVIIGGQAGVSGHLKIGNNVKIGGGSGVINDIPNKQNFFFCDINLRNF